MANGRELYNDVWHWTDNERCEVQYTLVNELTLHLIMFNTIQNVLITWPIIPYQVHQDPVSQKL